MRLRAEAEAASTGCSFPDFPAMHAYNEYRECLQAIFREPWIRLDLYRMHSKSITAPFSEKTEPGIRVGQGHCLRKTSSGTLPQRTDRPFPLPAHTASATWFGEFTSRPERRKTGSGAACYPAPAKAYTTDGFHTNHA